MILKAIELLKVAVKPYFLVLVSSGEGLLEGTWEFFSEATGGDKGGARKGGEGFGTKEGTHEGVYGEERVFLDQGCPDLE